MCFMGKRYKQVMETRVLKLLKLMLVLEVAIFGHSNWPFPADHLPGRSLLYLYHNSFFKGQAHKVFSPNPWPFLTVFMHILIHVQLKEPVSVYQFSSHDK